jgi:branched-chain amino acid transport system ATP-binding protein
LSRKTTIGENEGRGFVGILQVNKVSKYFGKLAAVKGLSFEVERGEIFGIAGPNGAGKTTLFNLISGAYYGSGDIIFEGENLHGLRPFEICHNGVARTFQVPSLFSTVSIYQNIRVGAHFGVLKGKNEKERIDRVIDFVGLRGRENAIAESVDLFDKRMTMLAAALATEPRLLLVDEPIGGLSPREVRDSVTLFQKINKELGITIIIIEHLMKVLVEVSHRLMILNSGEKICIGPPDEVTQDRKVIEVYLGD